MCVWWNGCQCSGSGHLCILIRLPEAKSARGDAPRHTVPISHCVRCVYVQIHRALCAFSPVQVVEGFEARREISLMYIHFCAMLESFQLFIGRSSLDCVYFVHIVS